MLTDKEIFDAIRERRGSGFSQDDVDTLNKLLHPTSDAPTYDRRALEAELILDEGERLKAYRDTRGKWTIGIGHNIDDCGVAPLPRTREDVLANGITATEVDQLFDYDIARSEADLDKAIPWWRSLDPVRQRVLLDMCFNMGWGAGTPHGLHTFVNTLAMIESKEYARAADAMMQSGWSRQVGDRAQRLANMMRNGKS